MKWGLIKFDDRELRNENETRKGGRIDGEAESERKRERKMEAVDYENFSDVAASRFMIFHRTATESGE